MANITPSIRPSSSILAILILLCTEPSTTHAVEIECPRALQASSLQLADSPAGWRFFAQSPIYLHSAAPMSTAPEKLGHLVHESVKKKDGGEIYSYKLDGPFPEGKWLQCAYGTHHQLTLSRRLDDSTMKCTITYRRGEKAGENKLRIQCE